MTEDDLIQEGLEFIQAHPTATARRIEEHLWAELDGHDRDDRDDGPRMMMHGEGFLILRLFRRLYYGGRVRRAMQQINVYLANERKRAKRRRAEGRDTRGTNDRR